MKDTDLEEATTPLWDDETMPPYKPTANSFWDEHSGKILAALIITGTVSIGGWALQMDRSSQKIQYQLDNITLQLDQRNSKLNLVYELDKRITRIEDTRFSADDASKRFQVNEARIKAIEDRR